MDNNTTITLKKHLNVTDLAGEKVMIDFESGKYFMIKGAGNEIWDYIQNPITVGEIIEKLLAEYDVSEEECSASVYSFLGRMLELGFI